MADETIKKLDLLDYSFYDDNNKLVTVLNEQLLKDIFKSDIILLKETEHR